MKSVLISIQPKWCELIALGKKTVEVRKTRPKIEAPFKVYIYCTNWKDNTYWKNHYKDKLGKVIGEFVCDEIFALWSGYSGNNGDDCLTFNGRESYLGFDKDGSNKMGYGWHISNLVIYDKPRELSEFRKPKMPTGLRYENDAITRPPQSWCYVEGSSFNE
jgi:predicted transcriptional regulator